MILIHMVKHGAILALLFMLTNCFTVDMYSGNNHIHFGSTNTTNQTGTVVSAEFPHFGINFNQSSPNVTSLESALAFIAKAYNNFTQNYNKTKMVIDSEQTTRKPRYKHVRNHDTRPNRVKSVKKVLSLEELARLLKNVRDGSQKRDNLFFRFDDRTRKAARPSTSEFFKEKEDKHKFSRPNRLNLRPLDNFLSQRSRYEPKMSTFF
ncbi:hypothetical protein BpHYR1_028928 [Brachionus plicatilis]|uniref:Uncharacterized protein n=1 Tax=Brachionus plicatilis TaxID=10195 RepID=A0A3M7RS02_BRAPC|nr:hypothetical protein BpHYR1_028928 [Brachionus plicatilis]